MSTPTNDGGPAFPSPALPEATDDRAQPRDGMTLRDYFASNETLAEWDSSDSNVPKGMAEALAGRPMPANGWGAKTPEQWLDVLTREADWRARLKYIRADAMLRARDGGAK